MAAADVRHILSLRLVVGRSNGIQRQFGLRPHENPKLTERFQTNTHLQIGPAMSCCHNLIMMTNQGCNKDLFSHLQGRWEVGRRQNQSKNRMPFSKINQQNFPSGQKNPALNPYWSLPSTKENPDGI